MRVDPVTLIFYFSLALGTVSVSAVEKEDSLTTYVTTDSGLTLHDVYVAALANDSRNGVANAYRLESEALAVKADGMFADAPALSLRQQSDRTGTDRGLREWEANVEMPLWRLGQRSATRSEATSMELLASAQALALQLDVAGRVRTTLWELALVEQQRDLASRSWLAAQELERDVQHRVEAGDLAQADLLLARDETLGKHDEYLLALDGVRAVKQRYLLLSGMQEPPAEFRETQSPRERIEPDHPLLLEAQRRVETTQAELRRVRAAGSGNPLLIVGSRREREPVTQIEHDSIGVSLRVPFGGVRYSGSTIAAANSKLVQAQAEQLALQRKLELELHDAVRALDTLRAELDLAEQQHTMAQQSLHMARIAFDSGEIDLVQRLRVQARTYAAERSMNQRKLQLQQAVARYNQAVGDLP